MSSVEIPHHASLYWEKQIMSLAVEVICFLDILIAVGKTGAGGGQKLSCDWLAHTARFVLLSYFPGSSAIV